MMAVDKSGAKWTTGAHIRDSGSLEAEHGDFSR
jgi:hypothetical protein